MIAHNLPIKKTKIVCTIGPASNSIDTLIQMIKNGMNVARINFAHGDLASHQKTVANIRAAADVCQQQIAVLGDLPGPKMRVGDLVDGSVNLEKGQQFILQTTEVEGTKRIVSVSYSDLPNVVKTGDHIYLNDGFIQLVVEKVKGNQVFCVVLVGGELRSFKGINLPGIELGICAFTERDKEFIKIAKDLALDAVGQSFVQEPADIHAVRSAADEIGYSPFIIAKIERLAAVENLDQILDRTDGIMVARGDLGVEIPIEEIALVQKKIINRANFFGKPVITATHMLESMVANRRPTRAEATDVANAILDGTDCVMLSEETAMGKFPEEAVAVMTRIAEVTEANSNPRDVAELLKHKKEQGMISPEDLISLSIFLSVNIIQPVAVITPTMSGSTARLTSRYKLPFWIVAVSPNKNTCQSLIFSYGVFPIYELNRPKDWELYARDWLSEFGFDNGMALLTKGSGTGHSGGTNQIEIINLDRPYNEKPLW